MTTHTQETTHDSQPAFPPRGPASSMLTFNVWPPERFEQNKIPLTSVAFSKHFICVQGTNEQGHRTTRVYNQSGLLAGEGSSLTGGLLSELLTGKRGLGDHVSTKIAAAAPFESLSAPYSVVEFTKDKLRSVQNADGSVGISSALVGGAACNDEFVTLPELVGGESTGRYIVFRSATHVIVSDTQGANETRQEPRNWTHAEFTHEEFRSALQKYPFLAELIPSADGRLLPNGNHSATCFNGILTIAEQKNLQKVHSDYCNGYAVDPSDENKIMYVNPTARTMVTIDLAKTTPTAPGIKSRPLSFEGNVTDIKFDDAGNFIFCAVVGETPDSSRMIVLDKNTGAVCAEVPGVNGPITVDAIGNIYFIDHDSRLRCVGSNVATMPVGGIEAFEREARARAFARLQSVNDLTLPELPESESVSTSHSTEQLDEALAEKLREKFNNSIAQIADFDALERFEAKITILRHEDTFATTPHAFDLVQRDINEKRRGLKLAQLTNKIEEVVLETQQLGQALTFVDLERIDRRISELRKLRADLLISDPDTKTKVDQDLESLREWRAGSYARSKKRVVSDIKRTLADLKQLFAHANSRDEVNAILIGPNYESFKALVNSLDEAEDRKAWRASVRGAIQDRMEEIEAEAQQHALREAEKQREAAEAMAEHLRELRQRASMVATPAELKELQNSILMEVIAKESLALSTEAQAKVQASLSTVLQKAGQRVTTARQLQGVTRSGGQISIGREQFWSAGEYSPIIKPIWQSEDGTLGRKRLMFEDGFGRTFAPTQSALNLNPDSEEFAKWKERAHQEAVSHFRELKRITPGMRSNWVMTRHTVECLEKIIRELNLQRGGEGKTGKGILILEGEAGTGKNVLIDMLAHLADYERFLFACNSQTQKEDLTFQAAFTPEKGTYLVDAKLVEKLTTPYVINAFDEINTLPPGVLKMLNSLLDERRCLCLSDGREVAMDPSSYLVGFMNPRHYVGTQELSQEVVSRANFVTIGYPPLLRNGDNGSQAFAPDEALMLSRSVRGLSTLTPEDFEGAWNAVINNQESGSGLSDDQQQLLRGLHLIVKVANVVRTEYSNYQTNQATEPMDFVFCLRTGSSIAQRLRPDSDPMEIIKQVTLPKVATAGSRLNLERILKTA